MIDGLCDHGACSGALVLPVGLQNTDSLVVSAETVDSGFDEDEAELGVLVLSVALEVLADGDGLLDQHVEVFWNFWGKTCVTLSVLWTNAEALMCHLPERIGYRILGADAHLSHSFSRWSELRLAHTI